ncbi:MAG: hypothetical protein GY694_10485 [Gammaproteobacteria bacterium]|nr:hypothetical protein [Gammaproteobacteria bacterium]
MGFLDFLLTTQQKKEKIATKIGLDSGLFTECLICRDITEAGNHGGHNKQSDALIHQLISSHDSSVDLFNGDEEELRNTLDKVAENLPYDCTCHNS